MAKQALWRGSKRITEAPDSPDWEFGNDKDTCTRVFVGPYAACLRDRPTYGASMADLPPELRRLYFVRRVRLRRAPGQKGILTVTAEYEHMSGSRAGDKKESEPQDEIEWTQIERPLEQHPLYQEADNTVTPPRPAGARALSADDLNALAMWEREEDYKLRKDFKFKNPDGEELTLSANAQHLARKKLRGQDTYLVFAPVFRRTTQMRACPDGSLCGRRQRLTFLSGDMRNKYEYLQSADRGTRSGDHGRWQRAREWTGAEYWDPDIYPSATT